MKKEVVLMMLFAIALVVVFGYSLGDEFALFWTSTIMPNSDLSLFGYISSVSLLCVVLVLFLVACIVAIHKLARKSIQHKTEDHLVN